MTVLDYDRKAHVPSLIELRRRTEDEAIFPDGLTGSCFECAAPMHEDGICGRCDARLTTEAKAEVLDEKCTGCGAPDPSGLCPACDPWKERAR